MKLIIQQNGLDVSTWFSVNQGILNGIDTEAIRL
jgi:hypothetical protein